MMQIESEHKQIYAQVKQFLNDKDERFSVSSDYNNVIFKLSYSAGEGLLNLSFTCYNFQQIYAIAGDYMVQKYYSKYTLQPTPEKGFDITLSFDQKQLSAPIKPPKQASQEEIQAIREENRKKRDENDQIIARVASDFSRFKRNFYAACFEFVFDSVSKGTVPAPFKYQSRVDETVYVVPEKESVSVFFGVSFQDDVDKILANLILVEMVDAKKQVKNAPSVQKSFGNEAMPEILLSNFPDLKTTQQKYNNGLVGITLFQKSHFAKNYEQVATLLQGLRQYLHYHIHASKTYLHSRIVRRINQFQRQLWQAQFEKEDTQYYRTTTSEQEEKKQGVVA